MTIAPSPPNKLKAFALSIVHFPREYIHALRKAQGHKRWLGLLFLALVGFNLIDMLSAQPADAELLTDLTLVGRKAGEAIMQFSFTMMQDLYGGQVRCPRLYLQVLSCGSPRPWWRWVSFSTWPTTTSKAHL